MSGDGVRSWARAPPHPRRTPPQQTPPSGLGRVASASLQPPPPAARGAVCLARTQLSASSPALPPRCPPCATLVPRPPHRGRACGWLGGTHQEGPRGETPKGLREGRGGRCSTLGPAPAPSRGSVLLSSDDRLCFCASCPRPVLPLGLGAGSPPWERTSSGPRNSSAWTEITLASEKSMEN